MEKFRQNSKTSAKAIKTCLYMLMIVFMTAISAKGQVVIEDLVATDTTIYFVYDDNIISPSDPQDPVDISEDAVIQYKSVDKISIKNGFKAGDFNEGGSFKAFFYVKPETFVSPAKRNNNTIFKTSNNVLLFNYLEKYVDSDGELSYSVYDSYHNSVSSSEYTLTNLDGGTDDVFYGNNRYELDVTDLDAGIYIIEILSEKSEKFILKFEKE